MNASFQEKSLAVTFLALIIAFGFYVAHALPMASPHVLPHQVGLFVVAVIVLVVSQVVGHLIVAVVDRRDQSDERDRLIGLKGTRNGAFVLAVGVFGALCAALVVPGNFVFMHVLLAAWVLAQLVEIASQLYLYRRGA